MTPCERFKDKIFDLVDQELDGSMREQVLQHIEECSLCGQFYRNLQSLKNGLKQIKPIEAPDSFQVILRERIRREMAHKPGLGARETRTPLRVWGMAFTFAAAAAAAFFVFFNPMQKNEMPRRATAVAVLGETHHNDTDRVMYVIDDLDHQNAVLISDESRQPRTVSPLDSMLAEESESVITQLYQPVRF